MNQTTFIVALAALTPALTAVLHRLAGLIRDELREGNRRTGFTMIGMIAAIVATALPWWML